MTSKNNMILEKEVFERTQIEKRMQSGGFNSIARFELFIWDLEMFLQLQKKLGDKIILKGGAAAQFFIPIGHQRTSIDIDMICTATRKELHEAISEIEAELSNKEEYFIFKLHKPKNPKLVLSALETYYEKVPSICNDKELYSSRGNQEVKIEILFSNHEYPINKIKQPKLFALETKREFNVLALEYLFADKLTTLGPTTIGIPDERADEQLKQIYDVITLFNSNMEQIISNKEKVREFYNSAAKIECNNHNILYDPTLLLQDMQVLINRIRNIETDDTMLQLANNFQSLYLRSNVNRNKAQWAIVGYQLELLIEHIFNDDTKILHFRDIEKLINKLKFENVRGPERGRLVNEVRDALKSNFKTLPELSTNLFQKRLDRIIWELASVVSFETIDYSLKTILAE